MYFNIFSIVLLLYVDSLKILIDDLLKIEDNRLVLPITFGINGENLIEIIMQNFKAGYLNNYV